MIVARFAFLSCASFGLAASLGLTACSGTTATGSGAGGSTESTSNAASTSNSASSGSAGGAGGAATTTTTGSGGATTGTGGGAVSTVTFTYTPQWEGVTAVGVVGAFGTSTDWTTPFVTLKANTKGTWTGTAQLPAGQYEYLFEVTGDADGPMNLKRYSIDPGLSAFVKCTAGPSFGADPNPCSNLTVPQGTPDTQYHITGKATYGGQPIKGYLALVERDETSSHHYFANRVDTAADGSFDLSVAAGTYRIQMQYPTLLSMDDTMRDPLTLKALRRAISAAFPVAAAVALDPVEMEYLGYAALTPTGTVATMPTTTMPTTLTFSVIAGSKAARAAVYGTKGGTGLNIGDPWYASAYGTTTTAAFTGAFPTMQALETTVMSGEPYFWGTWQELDSTAPAMWTGESMVFTIKWN